MAPWNTSTKLLATVSKLVDMPSRTPCTTMVSHWSYVPVMSFIPARMDAISALMRANCSAVMLDCMVRAKASRLSTEAAIAPFCSL